MSKRGPTKCVVYSRVLRISVTSDFEQLVPFFKQMESLSRGKRNTALLTALDRGAALAQESLAQPETTRVARGIDAMLDVLGE